MDVLFITLSTFAFVSGIVWLIVSGIGFFRLTASIEPMLAETKDNIQDLGDLSANTVGRVADTVDLVELRVSQAMGQATQGGAAVTKQALGVGTVLAGIYVASRVVSAVREQFRNEAKGSSKRYKARNKR